jgi:hypothetical protein
MEPNVPTLSHCFPWQKTNLIASLSSDTSTHDIHSLRLTQDSDLQCNCAKATFQTLLTIGKQ